MEQGLNGLQMRLVKVAVLAALALAAAIAAPSGAEAHWDCDPDGTGPSKNSNGRLVGTGRYTCQGQHAITKVCVSIQAKVQGQWDPVGDNPVRCNEAYGDTSAVRQRRQPCSGNGYYRMVTEGFAKNVDGDLVHHGKEWSTPVYVQCSPGELANTGGVFDDLTDLQGDVPEIPSGL